MYGPASERTAFEDRHRQLLNPHERQKPKATRKNDRVKVAMINDVRKKQPYREDLLREDYDDGNSPYSGPTTYN